MRGRRRKKKEAQALLREIAGKIKARRLTLGLSLTDVGAAMGITYQTVQKYESGTTDIPISRCCEICRVLDLPLQELVPCGASRKR